MRRGVFCLCYFPTLRNCTPRAIKLKRISRKKSLAYFYLYQRKESWVSLAEKMLLVLHDIDSEESGGSLKRHASKRSFRIEARTLSNDCEDAVLLQIFALHHRRQSTVILESILAIGCNETKMIFYFLMKDQST